MESKSIERIVMIGSGNVATHLSIALSQNNKKIVQIISKTEQNAKILADKVGCAYTAKIEDTVKDADIYIMAVSDNSIGIIAESFPHKEALIVHTAGSVSMDVLSPAGSNYGVFYPLQTFTKDLKLDYSSIPFCIEASKHDIKEKLKTLASDISSSVYEINLRERQILHIAAVFACNFTNHLYSIAADILQSKELPFDILRPLIEETARKAVMMHPDKAQTGPAARNDSFTINKHLEELNQFSDYQKIYTFISQSILKNSQKEKK